jgi:hypothetical protein
MPTFIETSRRLVLRYDEGQFSFNRFDEAAGADELYTLANYINAVQADDLDKVVLITVRQIV